MARGGVRTITGRSAPPPRRVSPRPAPRIPTVEKTRRPGPPLRVLGPRPFIAAPEQTDAPGPVPAWLQATLPEWVVYWWLSKRRNLMPERDFFFQSSQLGGRRELGGLVVDFLLPGHFPPGLVINVQGFHWHRFTTQSRENDLVTKLRLQDQGFTVAYVLDSALVPPANPEYVLSRALAGQQVYADWV